MNKAEHVRGYLAWRDVGAAPETPLEFSIPRTLYTSGGILAAADTCRYFSVLLWGAQKCRYVQPPFQFLLAHPQMLGRKAHYPNNRQYRCRILQVQGILRDLKKQAMRSSSLKRLSGPSTRAIPSTCINGRFF